MLDGRHPTMENDLTVKITVDGRRLLMEDKHLCTTTLNDGRPSSKENEPPWINTFDGSRPLI